jgi:hypothetical protein
MSSIGMSLGVCRVRDRPAIWHVCDEVWTPTGRRQHSGSDGGEASMDATIRTRTSELDELRRRRAELRETMTALERSICAPAADQPGPWIERTRVAAGDLAAEFVDHITVTEGPDGLHQAILAGDLRLANAVQALTDDHAALTEEIQSLIRRLDAGRSTPTPDTAAITEHAVALLAHLTKHRQQGADLIYEAYQTDLGGGD